MIQLIYTGGTIGMVPSASGLAPNLERFASAIAQHVSAPVTWQALAPLLDSSQIQPPQWQQIIDAIDLDATASIILHGTDTLAYSAAVLALFLPPSHSVILTGSQKSWFESDSDAPANLDLALSHAGKPGCHIAFGGQLLPGLSSHKSHTESFQGFAAYHRQPPAAFVEAPIQPLDYQWLTPTPGQSYANRQPSKVLVLENLGSGQLPNDPDLLELASQAETLLVTSQCPFGAVDIQRYAASEALNKLGSISCGAARREEIIAALYAAYSQTQQSANIWLVEYFRSANS